VPGQGGTDNRLVEVSNSGDPDDTSFVYDADGVRVKRVHGDDATYYIGPIEIETDQGDVTETHSIYSLGGGVSAVRVVASAGDDGEVTFTFGDHLGSSSTIWQAGELGDTDQGVRSFQRYYPYGEPRDDYSPALPTDHTFTGQITDGLLGDGGTGLMYYGARYYDPEIGRFAAADTIVPDPGDPQDLNRYTYVGNNPVNGIDPSGHWPHLPPRLPPPSEILRKIVLQHWGTAISEPDYSPLQLWDFSIVPGSGPGSITVWETEGSVPLLEYLELDDIAVPVYGTGVGGDSPNESDADAAGANTTAWVAVAGVDGAVAAVALARAADRMSYEYADEYGWSDQQRNAFLHAYWIGGVALSQGSDLARALGVAHERDSRGYGVTDAAKDFYNNYVGIFFAEIISDPGYVHQYDDSEYVELREILAREITYGGSLACIQDGVIVSC